MTNPLSQGEHVDLDTGTTVIRNRRHGNRFIIQTTNESGTERTVDLEDEEIRQIAELAGYTVEDNTGLGDD